MTTMTQEHPSVDLDDPRAYAAVLGQPCPLCGAEKGRPCQWEPIIGVWRILSSRKFHAQRVEASRIYIDIATKGIIAPPPAPQFSPSRYPYTYAYDFVRNHPGVVGAEGFFSRSHAAGFVRGYVQETQQDLTTVLIALANAYCREWAIDVPYDAPAVAS